MDPASLRRASAAALLLATAVLASSPPALAQNNFRQVDLVSDVAGRAAIQDADLVNPWGLVPGPTGVFWASDNGTGKSTLYQPDGSKVSLVVTIPGGENTGIDVGLFGDSSFVFPSADTTARAIFIFVAENGTIFAWNNNVNLNNAVQVASTTDAIYLGAA